MGLLHLFLFQHTLGEQQFLCQYWGSRLNPLFKVVFGIHKHIVALLIIEVCKVPVHVIFIEKSKYSAIPVTVRF